MVFGITGNTLKANLWAPVEQVIAELRQLGHPFRLHAAVAAGLLERGFLPPEEARELRSDGLPESCDLLLSFGGDGTLLNTAAEVGDRGTPILGVNIGRLGFLAHMEAGLLSAALHRLARGEYVTEPRMVLEADAGDTPLPNRWALNECVIQRTGAAGLLSIEIRVDGRELNTYWADGIIVATPTGSTAYNLAVGGPIVSPGSGTIVLTPLAPHTLTVRPVVVPDDVVIEARVVDPDAPYVFTLDGRGTTIPDSRTTLTIRRAAHTVNLVAMPGHDFFSTLRNKLMWGARKT
jgi:NAD+ kinase